MGFGVRDAHRSSPVHFAQDELENAVSEMCEDIRDKDDAVDKAAKIIEMLRADVHTTSINHFRMEML